MLNEAEARCRSALLRGLMFLHIKEGSRSQASREARGEHWAKFYRLAVGHAIRLAKMEQRAQPQ